MKAMLCEKLGPPENLVLKDIDPPKIRKGHVRIAVRACGMNYPDTLMIEGQYQVKPPLPFSPGSEIAGTVFEVGEGVTRFKIGDRVLAILLCGGLAEEVVVHENAIIPIPDSMDFDTAAGFMLTYGTAYHALKQRAQLQPEENLLVLGAAGGVGLATVELGKAMGARVIAAASTDEKLAVAQGKGADELVNYSTTPLKERVKKLTGLKGADVIFDPVGGDLFDQAVRLMNWNGRYLVVGFASGRIPELPVNLALLKGFSLCGVFWGTFTLREPEAHAQNCRELMLMFEEGKISPLISETFPLAHAGDALYKLKEREATGKLVVHVRPD